MAGAVRILSEQMGLAEADVIKAITELMTKSGRRGEK